MKNKSSNNTLNTDSLSERNQESTEEGEIKLLDVVALTQDVPEHNLKRGEVGTVVEILSNGEAFEVEFSDDNGQMYKCLSFLVSQLRVIHDEPINVNSNRQANDALQGYYYQLCHTVNSWLDLTDNDILHLEVAEDFDIESDRTFRATQVKHTRDNITLRSQQVIDGINNYWELRTNNPDRHVKFRLLTKSKIGREQGNPLGTDKPGLEVWSRCSGDEAAIKRISDFLQTDGKISEEVNDFLKVASPQEIYEQLIEPITWETDSKSTSFVERSINDKLVIHGDRQSIPVPPSDTKKVVDRLLREALTVSMHKENRVLTKVRFLKIFEEQTTRRIPEHQWLQYQRMLAARKGPAGFGFTDDPSDTAIQSQFAIQNTIPLPYYKFAPRTDKVANIKAKLQSDGIVVIQGGVDTGKTTLAKLTANAIHDGWFWLNLRKNHQSQVAQLLHQLSIVVGNESAQFNVVLDDLNLQPQELQEYEDILGVVIYRGLERSVKLLIVSQHKPPDNFIRSLGLSSSIVVDDPNFTTSEIEQFAAEMGCPAEHAKTWAELVQIHTSGHPRLVHARLTQLQQEDWKHQGKIESILQTPQEVVKERKEARQLLMGLPEDQREFLYRLSLLTEFRKDYSLNIGEIPEPIPDSGDVFSQLVGPWIDQVGENYYTISPLLKNATEDVWSESKKKDLHAHIADAIRKTKDLTTTEARAVLLHSILGQNKEGIIAVIGSLMTAPEDSWGMLNQEFSWLRSIKIDPYEEFFPGETFINYFFRSLQYRIAVEVEPEFAPKILEVWDKETKPYEPRQSYLLSRLMLASQVLRYNQVPLPVKKLVSYIKEMIDIKDSNRDAWEMYLNSMGQIEEHITDKSNFFSFLFSFIYVRHDISVAFLNELIDALDEFNPRIRTLLLADFENDNSIEAQLLINGASLAEANCENPDWTRCIEVFNKVIEKTIEWDYPHIAAASARGKAIIYDEYLNNPDTAHTVLQDIASKVGDLSIIEEERALVYLHQKRYKEALNIYERLLPEWNPPSEQLGIGPLEEYRRAAICAASLDDWKKAATFLEEGAKKTQKIENTERYIGLYADAGFAQFKADNMLDSIKLLDLTLQKFEMLPQDNTDVKYFTLKKRLAHTLGWIVWHESEGFSSEFAEPPVGFCSDPETNEKFLDLPDSPIGYLWSALARTEYKFGQGTTVLAHALQIAERDADPALIGALSLLEVQYDFRNKTFDNLPQRIHQLVNAYVSKQMHHQNGKGVGEKGVYSIPIADLFNFASVENITVILTSALLAQPSTNKNGYEILAIWRTSSSELPIKENIFAALDLIEPILFGDQNQALRMMKTQDVKPEERLVAALKIVYDTESSPNNLFYAHTFIATTLISETWEGFVVTDLANLLTVQWLEKIKFRAALKMPMITVPQIEKACNSSEPSKKKIGQILLAVHQAVSLEVPSDILQQFRSWSESTQQQEPTTKRNPTAQRLITAMEKPPHLTDEDVEALRQSIEEGKISIRFNSPFEPNEPENNE